MNQLESIGPGQDVLVPLGAIAWLIVLFPASTGLLIAGLAGDRRRREPRHWLHWTGVAVIAPIQFLISLIVTLVFVFGLLAALVFR